MGSHQFSGDNRRQARRQRGGEEPASALDIFLAWLLWLPDTSNLVRAAEAEIARLDGSRIASPTVAALRDLLDALVRSGRPH